MHSHAISQSKRGWSGRRGALALLLFGLGPVSARAEDACSLLLEKTRAFSDASQTGDGAVLGALLDEDVIFYNEGGDAASRKELAASTKRPPRTGVATRMTVTDWVCRLHGDVAVASFVDEQRTDLHGTIMVAKYRSVETWLRRGPVWRMIGSETIALQDDPPAVSLPETTLDDYVGVYRAAPELIFTYARDRSGLTVTINGGPPTTQKAEVKDVFFTPGQPRIRRIFQRDATGRVTGMISRHEGHDVVFKRV